VRVSKTSAFSFELALLFSLRRDQYNQFAVLGLNGPIQLIALFQIELFGDPLWNRDAEALGVRSRVGYAGYFAHSLSGSQSHSSGYFYLLVCKSLYAYRYALATAYRRYESNWKHPNLKQAFPVN
jgi:hypothetical protein